MKVYFQELAYNIFEFCTKKCIHLKVELLPRDENGKADHLSKIIERERDDWGISQDIISILNRRWGSFCARVHR